MNNITLIGNLTKDPELSQLPSGIYVCKFDLAVARRYADANGERETDFFHISAWRGLGENCAKYLSKGKKAAVTGSIQFGEYTDKNGVKRQSVNVVADNVEFLSPRDDDEDIVHPNDVPKPKPKKKTVDELRPVDGDDLPF